MRDHAPTPCPVGRKELLAAGPITVTITDADGDVLFSEVCSPRTFSTGSIGWQANGKAVAAIARQSVKLQIGGLVTAVGSKLLPATETPTE